MAHHIFKHKALLQKKNANSFYGNELLDPIEVTVHRQVKCKLVKTANNNEIQSKMSYLFPIGTDISPGDIVDGNEVLITNVIEGISIQYIEVYT